MLQVNYSYNALFTSGVFFVIVFILTSIGSRERESNLKFPVDPLLLSGVFSGIFCLFSLFCGSLWFFIETTMPSPQEPIPAVEYWNGILEEEE